MGSQYLGPISKKLSRLGKSSQFTVAGEVFFLRITVGRSAAP